MPFDKSFSQLTADDIISLIQNKVSEDKNLEFKQQVPKSNDEKSKIKICQNISSFANTDGGIIIFGLKQNDKGEANEIINIEEALDEFSLQLQNMVRDRIVPKIQLPNLREICVDDKKVFLAEILPSYNKPHFVKSDWVFYGRHSSGKYQLDVHEIKSLFLSQKSVEEQFEQFRVQRLMKIKSRNFPLHHFSDHPIVVHFAPLSFAQDGNLLPLRKIKSENNPFGDLHKYGHDKSFNFDGLMFYSKFPDNLLSSYTQIFRNGIIEFVDFFQLESNEKKEIHGNALEVSIKNFLETIIPFIQKYEKDFPFFFSISLINVQGFHISASRERHDMNIHHNQDFNIISDTDIIVPSVFIENQEELMEKLNTCFDIIWNSSGYDKNPAR